MKECKFFLQYLKMNGFFIDEKYHRLIIYKGRQKCKPLSKQELLGLMLDYIFIHGQFSGVNSRNYKTFDAVYDFFERKVKIIEKGRGGNV